MACPEYVFMPYWRTKHFRSLKINKIASFILKMWVLYPIFSMNTLSFFSNSTGGGGVKARHLLDTHLPLYCNNNSVIYLKSNIQKVQ